MATKGRREPQVKRGQKHKARKVWAQAREMKRYAVHSGLPAAEGKR